MHQNFIPLQMEEKVVKKKKLGNLILTISFIFIIIMLFFSTIGYSSLYTNDKLLYSHIKVKRINFYYCFRFLILMLNQHKKITKMLHH